MPQRKSVESLSDLCVQSIANHLDKFRSSSADGPGISLTSEKDIPEDEMSCFESLPSQLVVTIMDAALLDCCTALKDKDLLALPITSHLDTLNLINCLEFWSCSSCGPSPKLDDQTILHLLGTAALRHSPLKTLGFSLSGSVPCPVFKDLLPAFPNLKKLDVSDSSDETINDDFLALLVTRCVNLEELRLINCKGVTDVGIQQLCGSQEGTGGGDRGCKFLVRLNVEGTRVTRHGARLALEHLPRLQIFDYPTTLQTAAEMHRTKGSSRQLSLKNLNAECVNWVDDDEVPYVRGSLMHALRLCPLIVDVNLTSVRSLEDDDLAGLLNLNGLKKLAIDACEGISFDGGLLPILKKFGPSSLESLTLSGVREVNIGSIVEFCSNLRVIRLEYIQRYIPSSRPGLRRMNPRHPLPHLRHLTIRGYFRDLPADQPSRAELFLLFSSSPELEGIRLDRLRGLNDGIMEEAMAQHGFPKLESFQAERCPGITKRVVDRLLELDNPLSFIYIEKNNYFKRCSNRHDRPDVDGNRHLFDPAWGKKIQENNWDLWIRYCECERVD